MIRDNLEKQTLPTILVAIIVLSAIAPFIATGTLADKTHEKCENKNPVLLHVQDCNEEILNKTHEDVRKLYNNITDNNFFKKETPAGKTTPWATVGGYEFRFKHVVDGKVHKWFIQVQKESESKGAQGKSKKVKLENPANAHEDLVDYYIPLLERLAEEKTSDKPNRDNNRKRDNNRESNRTRNNTTGNNETGGLKGGITDYDNLDTKSKPVSIFTTKFKDNDSSNEVNEYKAMPPYGERGNVRGFNARPMKISGTVGFAVNGIPDPSDGNSYLVINTSGNNPEGTVKVTDSNGAKLQSKKLGYGTTTVELQEDVIRFVKNQNSLYYTISNSENTEISCSSVVINMNSTPKRCDVGNINNTPIKNQSGDSNQTEDESTTTRGGAILDYNDYVAGRQFSESIRYVSEYRDGVNNNGYMERPAVAGEKRKGGIRGFPKMVDTNKSTYAMFASRDKNTELDVTMTVENPPIGRNHLLIVKYNVTKGEAPELKIHTSSHELSESLDDTKTVTVSKINITKLTKDINNNEEVTIQFTTDSGTKTRVYCTSIIANPSGEINCQG